MKTKMLLALFGFLFIAAEPVQTDEWKKDLEKILFEFMSCGGPTAPNTPCNEFLGKALKRVYGIKDFDKPGGRYMVANEMATYVAVNTDQWTLLGKGSEQSALNSAQGYANVKKAVIAVYSNPGGPGHVVLILPGTLTASGSWGLLCPNSASFFINKPDKAYIGKSINYAFDPGIKDKVLLYGRNF